MTHLSKCSVFVVLLKNLENLLCDLSPFGEYILLVLYHFCRDDFSEYVKLSSPENKIRPVLSAVRHLHCFNLAPQIWDQVCNENVLLTVWGRNLLGSNNSFRLVDCWPGKLKEKYELLQACSKHFAVSWHHSLSHILCCLFTHNNEGLTVTNQYFLLYVQEWCTVLKAQPSWFALGWQTAERFWFVTLDTFTTHFSLLFMPWYICWHSPWSCYPDFKMSIYF